MGDERAITIDEKFCEIYGAMIGDGCISRYITKDGQKRTELVITGDGELDEEYHFYLASLLRQVLGANPYIYKRKDENTRKISVVRKSVSEHFIALGFPVGDKGDIMIPEKLMFLPWALLRFVIRGIFDTDGCITAKRNEGYRYPFIIISSKSKPLIKQLHLILRGRGYPSYIKKNRKELRVRGQKNTIQWMEDIGSSNSRHVKKYSYWKRNNIIPVKRRACSSADIRP